MEIQWKADVDDHDYGAAEDYLTLLLNQKTAVAVVKGLRKAPLVKRRVNDILRASHREPLPSLDPGVARNALKVNDGKKLSPILVVSFEFGGDIADGYHRASLAYLLDPFAYIPLKLVSVSR